jgi:hypothetical protein
MPLDKDKLTESLVVIFSDLDVNATSKDKFIQIFEAIMEYSKGVVPPSATVTAFGDVILAVLRKFPGGMFSDGILILEKQLPKFAQGIAVGMLPLYKGKKPFKSLDKAIQRVMDENVAQNKSMKECAEAMADVIHNWFITGTAEATPIAVGLPPTVPSWGIGELKRNDLEYTEDNYSGIKWRPEDSDGHPNANRLRRVLRAFKYGEKGRRITGKSVGEISNGGDISNILASWVIFVINEIKRELPDVELAFTGGNDIFHQNLGYKSNHTYGNAMDFVVKPRSYVSQIEKILHGISGSPANYRFDGEPLFRFINEYAHISKAGTAPHFHITVHPIPPDSQESLSRAEKSTRLVSTSLVTERPWVGNVFIFEESTQSLIIEQRQG